MLLPPDDMVKDRFFSVHRVARTTSTQDLVRRAAARGAPDWYCCVAQEQTAGRGRLGRAWVAPAGTGLLASVLWRSPISVLTGVPFAAGLAVADALHALHGLAPGLKWPNDVLVGGRKLAGVLVEVERAGERERLAAVVTGLGLNLTVPGFPPGVNGVSLHQLVTTPPDADALLHAWLEALAARFDSLQRAGTGAVLDAWRARAVGIGAGVTVATPAGAVNGVAEGIDSEGALLVRTATGLKRVIAGDVLLAGAGGT